MLNEKTQQRNIVYNTLKSESIFNVVTVITGSMLLYYLSITIQYVVYKMSVLYQTYFKYLITIVGFNVKLDEQTLIYQSM